MHARPIGENNPMVYPVRNLDPTTLTSTRCGLPELGYVGVVLSIIFSWTPTHTCCRTLANMHPCGNSLITVRNHLYSVSSTLFVED